MSKLNPTPFVVLAFFLCLGYLLGGFHLALIFVTVWLGIVALASIFD